MPQLTKFILGMPERHQKDEFIDHVAITTVERYKQSGLSGDEYRFSYYIELSRKGTLMASRGFNKLETALAALPWMNIVWGEGSMVDDADKLDKLVSDRYALDMHTCFQPGCSKPGLHFMRMKKIHSVGCHIEQVLPESDRRYRCFCDQHKRRGDCGLNDADDNYILLFSLIPVSPLVIEVDQHTPEKLGMGYVAVLLRSSTTYVNEAAAIDIES